MTTTIINGQRVLTPAEGCVLVRTADGYITSIVYLGAGDTGDGWTETTEAEAQENTPM